MSRFSRILGILVLFIVFVGAVADANAAPIAGDYFHTTWSHTDQPVAAGQVNRTWMWGPSANTPALLEPYAESPNGQRQVQYFDKTRMEITHPDGDTSSIWYVTNGLLAKELITGDLQLGDNTFEHHDPATVNVAGDANDPNGPTYATFNSLMSYAATPNGWTVTQTVDRSGTVGSDQSLASYDVSAIDVAAPTNHTVASPFWNFMNSSGSVYDGGTFHNDKLFDNPFYATGYPLTEAYWTDVLVGGVNKQVLVQVFERRVLTYTPSNPDGWKVEAGNVGQHYYTWRYIDLNKSPVENPSSPSSPSPTPPSTGTQTSFGDGTFRVGTDIAPGTYRNSDWSQGCYWERLSGFGGTLDEIIANAYTDSQSIVTISTDDAGFSSDGCGTWVLDGAALTSNPASSFGAGTYRVGRDVAPGLWRNSDSSQSCYWERLSGFGGTFDDVITNGLSSSQQVVRIEPGDAGFSSDRCGSWQRIGD